MSCSDPFVLPDDRVEKFQMFKELIDQMSDNGIAENFATLIDGWYAKIIYPVVGIEDDDGIPSGMVRSPILAVFFLMQSGEPNTVDVAVMGIQLHDHMKITIEE